MVIGVNLATFIFKYVGGQIIAGDNYTAGQVINNYFKSVPSVQVLIAIATMIITAVVSHYGKGFMKNIPFLFGILGGYLIALIFTWCGIKIVDFSSFNNMT